MKDLSTGERNVISLCYFFSLLQAEQSEDSIFQNESLIVLDDPISSFDFENKIGIYSFLRYAFNLVFSGNEENKIVILTHSLDAVFQLQKIGFDLFGQKKSKRSVLFQELKVQSLCTMDLEKFNEYTSLVRSIFCFAAEKDGSDQFDQAIGNTMRRVMEAYGTFTYGQGIVGLSRNSDILQKIGSKDKQIYYGNLMYRLVLNGESHERERVEALPQSAFSTMIGHEEKVKTAKATLAFLYLLDPIHIRYQFKGYDDTAEAKIKSWSEEQIF